MNDWWSASRCLPPYPETCFTTPTASAENQRDGDKVFILISQADASHVRLLGVCQSEES